MVFTATAEVSVSESTSALQDKSYSNELHVWADSALDLDSSGAEAPGVDPIGAGLTCLLREEGPGCALLVMLLEGAFPAWSQTTGNSSSTGEFVPAGLPSRDWKVYHNV